MVVTISHVLHLCVIQDSSNCSNKYSPQAELSVTSLVCYGGISTIGCNYFNASESVWIHENFSITLILTSYQQKFDF